VFLADHQLRGRGRLGRQWLAPPGSSLLFSVVLRRDLPAVELTSLCSVSVVEAIQEVTGLSARIKWPNDVMIDQRKTCGVLTEVVGSVGQSATIVGVGINVNLDPHACDLPETTTSLSHESGSRVSREDLLYAALSQVESRLAQGELEMLQRLRARWEELLWRRHQRISVAQDGEVLTGIVEGLSTSGALRLRQEDGRVVEVTVGDVLGG